MIGNVAPSVYVDEYPLLSADEDESVAPTREVRSTDVSKISLTVPMAVSLALAVAIVVGAFWQIRGADNAELNKQLATINSAVVQMSTQLEAEARVNAADKRADAVVTDNIKQSVDELKRQTQLLQLQYSELSKAMDQRR